MLKLFVPAFYLSDYRDLDLDMLKSHGIRLLILDIDNTLIPFDQSLPTEDVLSFLSRIQHAGIQTVLISNNHKKRAAEFSKGLQTPYYADAKKPLKSTYQKILHDYRLKPEEVAAMGDQLLTDVLGANRSLLYAVLVKPLVERDIVYTKPNRLIENALFWLLKKKGLFDREKI